MRQRGRIEYICAAFIFGGSQAQVELGHSWDVSSPCPSGVLWVWFFQKFVLLDVYSYKSKTRDLLNCALNSSNSTFNLHSVIELNPIPSLIPLSNWGRLSGTKTDLDLLKRILETIFKSHLGLHTHEEFFNCSNRGLCWGDWSQNCV
jgi:hypothetical protein